ncbi:MAG: hypothetical protein ACRBB4_04115 [Neptuniibacter sp.]
MPTSEQASKLGLTISLLVLAAFCFALFSEGLVPNIPGHLDKIGHVIGFASICYVGIKLLKGLLLSIFLSAAIFFAVGSEFIQHYLSPSREFSLLDILANIVGCFLGIALLHKRRKQFLKETQQKNNIKIKTKSLE